MLCSKFISKLISLLSVALLFSITNAPVLWGNEPVSVDAKIDNLQPTLGDIITYSITAKHDSDILLHMPEYLIPEGMEKVQNGKNKLESNNNQNAQEFWLKLRVDKTGPIAFPAIPVWFDAPDQNKQLVRGKILTPEINIEVQSLLQLEGNASDIKDIKPIANIKPPWTHYLWKALGVVCLLVLAYFLWKKWKNRSPEKKEAAVILTAEEKAMQELEELQKCEWMKLGRIRDHFFELSEIFRRYLENRYKFPAQEWTTEEIIVHFKSFKGLTDNQKLQSRAILTEIDKVKFAKAEAHSDPIETIIEFIKEVAQTQETSEPSTVKI